MESKSGILLGQNSDPAFLGEGSKSQLHNLIPSEKRYKIGSSSAGKCPYCDPGWNEVTLV